MDPAARDAAEQDAAPGAPRGKVLVVDDQRNMRATTALLLRQAGHAVEEAESGAAAIRRVQQEPFDVVLTDLRMPDLDGLELLRAVREHAPDTQVIVMTAYGTIDSAVEAMRRGALDYVSKPFKEDELLLRIARAVERRRLRGQIHLLADDFRRRYGLEHIVGSSPAIREVLERVQRVAPTDATVLLTGESGTGKELVARALHASSRRSGGPFVPVNCAAITETLLESELFGHARGAFTGATKARRGLFEEAHGGTLFIDEIGETTPGFQAKLLRALQDGEIRRVGDTHAFGVDVRIVCATHRNLRDQVSRGAFREDLLYRLKVLTLRVPPLRERVEDILPLARAFVEQEGRPELRFTAAARRLLDGHAWPGNVRELANAVKHGIALARGETIDVEDLPEELRSPPPARPARAGSDGVMVPLAEVEREHVLRVLQACKGSQTQAALALGIGRNTLWRKLQRYA